MNTKSLLAQTVGDWNTLAGIAVVAGGVIWWREAYRGGWKTAFLPMWWGVSLLPVMWLKYSGSLFTEKYLFLGSFAVCLMLAMGVVAGKRRWLGIILLMVFAGLTIVRNRDWKDSVSLWTRTVEQSPLSIKAWGNLERAYGEVGRFEEAGQARRERIRLEGL
jgi:hypothetical protein